LPQIFQICSRNFTTEGLTPDGVRRRAKEGWGLYEARESPSKTKDFSKENLLKVFEQVIASKILYLKVRKNKNCWLVT